jgi:hypothetical protein
MEGLGEENQTRTWGGEEQMVRRSRRNGDVGRYLPSEEDSVEGSDTEDISYEGGGFSGRRSKF